MEQNFRTVDDCVNIEPCNVVFQGKKGKTVSRHMLPFIHCWDVTIHKMQGVTLDKAIVGLKCFNNGLEYVALSRVKTMQGLAVSRIDAGRFLRNSIVCKGSLRELGIEYRSLVNDKD